MTTETWDDSQTIQDALQEVVNRKGDSHGVVTAFVAVAEVMDGDGKKLVSYRGPNVEAVPIWTARGMLREVADDPDAFDEEDDDG